MRPTHNGFAARADHEAFVVSFRAPARVLSWAVLNGGFGHADHVINHHVNGGDRWFCAQPERWLEHAAVRLGLQGRVVAMATAVAMHSLVQASFSFANAAATCFATVGCGNVLTVGDSVSVAVDEHAPSPLHTINMILVIQPGLTDEAMVEAIQIATEGRVRALYEAGVRSSVSSFAATGTGTDCIAAVSLGRKRERYCGKHTKLGELIGRAAHAAVEKGLAAIFQR
jgi:adenosylcobinamide amidohydrolase